MQDPGLITTQFKMSQKNMLLNVIENNLNVTESNLITPPIILVKCDIPPLSKGGQS